MKSDKSKVFLVCHEDPFSPAAESYKLLRTNIQFAGVNNRIKTLMVTSALPGEGKTTIVCNLAITNAQAGKKVLLVDGDLRKPQIHQVFQISNRVGLTNLLIEEVANKEAIRHLNDYGIDVLTAGTIPPNPTEILGGEKMKKLLREFVGEYDVVVVDAPPLLPVADPLVLSACMDGVLVVCRNGKVARDQLKKVVKSLQQVGANIIGTVFNEKQGSDSRYTYY